jgi:hypothetical protein
MVTTSSASAWQHNFHFHQHNQQTERSTMEFITYIRRPFQVEAIEITDENIKEVAKLIGFGQVRRQHGSRFILVDRRIIPNIERVYVGWFLTKMGNNYRCYAPILFNSQFIQNAPEPWLDFLEEEPDDGIEEEDDPTPAHGIARPEA